MAFVERPAAQPRGKASRTVVVSPSVLQGHGSTLHTVAPLTPLRRTVSCPPRASFDGSAAVTVKEPQDED